MSKKPNTEIPGISIQERLRRAGLEWEGAFYEMGP
jgi:hypothetical protein